VNPLTPAIAWLLVLALLGVAGYFSWQQVQSLRALPRLVGLQPEDRRYLRNLAIRRITGCLCLVGIAVLIGAAFVSGLEARVQEISDQRGALPEGPKPALNEEQGAAVRLYAAYAVSLLLLLLGVVFLAAVDVWAIRRYGIRHYRRIQGDRRAMMERQLRQLRIERGRQREDDI
jgi:hypothetical protein